MIASEDFKVGHITLSCDRNKINYERCFIFAMICFCNSQIYWDMSSLHVNSPLNKVFGTPISNSKISFIGINRDLANSNLLLNYSLGF